MKQIFSKISLAFIFSLILLISMFAICAFAVTPSDGDITWKYTLNETDKTATITGANIDTDKTARFDIPETLEIEKSGTIVSYTVTGIGNSAFNNNKKVFGKLTIPNTVKAIGSSAFAGTYVLGDIVIPESVTSVGDSAFANCVGIYSVSLPTTLKTLNQSVFFQCYSLVEINTDHVVTYGDKCFYDCRSLVKVDITDNAKSIGNQSFYNCDSLSGTYDLSVVEGVNPTAFNNCDRITGFVIPNEISNILTLFSGCINVKEVLVSDANKTYSSVDGVLFSKNGETLVHFPYAKVAAAYRVPNQVLTIGANAFSYTTKLDRVILPETIVSIEKSAFSNSSIKDFYIPDSITEIKADTFKNCLQVEWIVIGAGVKSLGVDAFASTNTNLSVFSKSDKITRPNNVRKFTLVSEYQCIDHKYGYLDVLPDCVNYGYNKCVICDRLAYVKELGHTGPILEKVGLSCTSDAYSLVNCIRCKQEVKMVTQTTKGHTSHFVTTVATATTPGYVIGNCAVCGETYLESFTPHSEVRCKKHTYTNVDISTAQCKTNGLRLIYCQDCGMLAREVITPKSVCNFVETQQIQSTCTINGQLTETCTLCGTEKYTKLELRPHTHSWYTVSENKGVEYSSCSVCGTFESRDVDYSVFNTLLAQVSKYYEIYYAPDTVAMLKPIMDNKNLNLTQEAVDYNCALLSSILSNVKYNVKDIPVVFIEKEGSISSSVYSDATFYMAYIDEKGNYQVEAIERNGSIKIRGNSTANKIKNPYNIKFATNVDLFGLGAGKKYCLMANLFDQTLLRNAIAAELAHSLGLDYTQNFVMVEVYLNGENDGLYMLTTPADDISKDRVDINPETDFIVEVSSQSKDSANYIMGTNNMLAPFQNLRLVVEDTDEMSGETFSKLNSQYWQIALAIYSGDWEYIQEWVDVDSMAKYYILHEYLKALDYCYDSTRFYYEDGKLHGGPIWDFDYGLGNIEFGLGGTHDGTANGYHNNGQNYADLSEGTLNDSTTGFWANSQWGGCGNGYFKQLYNYSPEFVKLVQDYIEDYDRELTLLYADVTVSKKEVYQNVIDKYYEDEDYTAARIRNWQIYNIISDVDNACGGHIEISYNHAINYLRDWLKSRHAWMKQAYLGIVPATE